LTFRDVDPETGMLGATAAPDRCTRSSSPAPPHPRLSVRFFAPSPQDPLDREHFDEPPAITFDQFRRWAAEVDRERQNVEGWGGCGGSSGDLPSERRERWAGGDEEVE